jgi:hypothetical protein
MTMINPLSVVQPLSEAKRPLYQKLMVIITMMLIVGGSLTGIMTFVNVGYSETFLSDWGSSFAIATAVMMPSGFLLMIVMNKSVDFLFPNLGKHTRNMTVGVFMAFFMESIMAASTTANTIGFADIHVYASAWSQAFLTALPIGLFMAVAMSIFIKPKLEKFMAS